MDNIIAQTKAIFTIKDINRDNVVFKIFTQLSVGLCLLATILVGGSQYFGDPIACSHQTGISDDVVKAYCWIHGSRHVEGALADDSNCVSKTGEDSGDNFTGYYQWIVFMLGLNALIFRIPHAIWKLAEGGLLKQFCSKEAKSSLIIGNESTLQSLLYDYTIYFEKIKGNLKKYHITFLVCQALNLAMVSLNFHINNKFLFGTFSTYGSDVLTYMNSEAGTSLVDPMCNTFPTLVSCNMKTVGPSAGDQSSNIFCILSQNIINEKIYLILWFWFIFLFVIGIGQILMEVAFFFIPSLRNYLICWHLGTSLTSDMKEYLNSCSIGDWFFLCQIGKNSNKHFFYQFLKRLAVNQLDSDTGRAEVQPLVQVDNEQLEMVDLKV